MASRNEGEPSTMEAYWRGIRYTTPLTRERERELFHRVREGDEDALRQVIEANLRFVVSVARGYGSFGVPLEELVAEGNLGLVEAAKRFEPERGFKFITYAVWWIRNAIHRSLAEHGRAARRPVNQIPDLRRVHGTAGHLAQGLGRDPTFQEIAAAVGLSHSRTRDALAAAQPDQSLEAEPYDGGRPLSARLASQTPEADGRLESEERRQVVADALQVLDQRDRQILRAHYGFDADGPASLTQISRGLGVSRERVRQLKERALATLRARRGDLLAEVAGHSHP